MEIKKFDDEAKPPKKESIGIVTVLGCSLIILLFVFKVIPTIEGYFNEMPQNIQSAESYLERTEKERKSREDLIIQEFGVTSKEFILIDGDKYGDYELLIDGKTYSIVFNDDFTKIEKNVFKGVVTRGVKNESIERNN